MNKIILFGLLVGGCSHAYRFKQADRVVMKSSPFCFVVGMGTILKVNVYPFGYKEYLVKFDSGSEAWVEENCINPIGEK